MKINGLRVVVTGGAGFIGSHLVERLLRDDNEVVVIDDFSSGKPENLVNQRNNPHLRIEQSDIRNELEVFELLQHTDLVFHLACRNVRLSLSRPSEVHEVNVTGTFNVLKAATSAGVKRFLYCSSSEVNGTANLVPMPERYHYKPETIYGASKLAGEYYTEVFGRSGWLETIIARPHNTYGPREHYSGVQGEVIPRFIIAVMVGHSPVIYGNGEQSRDFTYVSETVDFLLRLMEEDRSVSNTYNICRGKEITINSVAKIVLEYLGSEMKPVYVPERPNDVLRLAGDPSRLHNLLGIAPQIDIHEGLARTIKWFKANVEVTDDLVSSVTARNWEDCDSESWLPITRNRQKP